MEKIERKRKCIKHDIAQEEEAKNSDRDNNLHAILKKKDKEEDEENEEHEEVIETDEKQRKYQQQKKEELRNAKKISIDKVEEVMWEEEKVAQRENTEIIPEALEDKNGPKITDECVMNEEEKEVECKELKIEGDFYEETAKIRHENIILIELLKKSEESERIKE